MCWLLNPWSDLWRGTLLSSSHPKLLTNSWKTIGICRVYDRYLNFSQVLMGNIESVFSFSNLNFSWIGFAFAHYSFMLQILMLFFNLVFAIESLIWEAWLSSFSPYKMVKTSWRGYWILLVLSWMLGICFSFLGVMWIGDELGVGKRKALSQDNSIQIPSPLPIQFM